MYVFFKILSDFCKKKEEGGGDQYSINGYITVNRVFLLCKTPILGNAVNVFRFLVKDVACCVRGKKGGGVMTFSLKFGQKSVIQL